MAAASSKWGAAGWWFSLVISVPFWFYLFPFAINDYESYRKTTLHFLDKQFDVAGHHVRDWHPTWQIHSIVAFIFLFTGLFQFAPNFRKSYPTIHRRMGYTYITAGMIQVFSGAIVMTPNCEFGTIGRIAFLVTGLDLFVSLIIAVRAARAKKFNVHRRWMIRAAAPGYSVIGVRIWIPILMEGFGMYIWHATEWAACLAFLSFTIPAEIYIRTNLSDAKKKPEKKEA